MIQVDDRLKTMQRKLTNLFDAMSQLRSDMKIDQASCTPSLSCSPDTVPTEILSLRRFFSPKLASSQDPKERDVILATALEGTLDHMYALAKRVRTLELHLAKEEIPSHD